MGTKLFLSVTSKRGKKICWEGEEKEDFNHRQNGHSFHLFVDDDDDNDDDDGNDDSKRRRWQHRQQRRQQ